MISEIAKKILSETPQEVREEVRKYGDEIVRRNAEIEATELDEQETRYALWVGKQIKWRKNQHPNSDFKPESKGEENK